VGKGIKAPGPAPVKRDQQPADEGAKLEQTIGGRRVMPSGGESKASSPAGKPLACRDSPLAKILAGNLSVTENDKNSGEVGNSDDGDGAPRTTQLTGRSVPGDGINADDQSKATATLASGGLRGAVIAKRGGAERVGEQRDALAKGGVSDPNVARSRERGHLGYFRPIRCFECGHEHKGSRSAKSSACPKCSTLVNLADVEVNCRHSDPIRTRGDVTVLKNGRLCGAQTICRDLILHGALECPAEIDGDLVIRGDAEVHVPLTCGRLIVERGATFKALVPIRVNSGEIDGEMIGDIISGQSVRIGGRGVVVGEVTARAIKIEPGGALDGRMNIVTGKKSVDRAEDGERPQED